MRRFPLAIVALLALAASGAALARPGAPQGKTVGVTMREFHISLSTASLPAGHVTFTVHNAGKLAHRLSMSGPGLRLAQTATIPPGKTKTLAVTLGGGTFKLWCPIGSHASAGMRAALKVTGAAAAPAPPATTTTGGGGYDDGGY